MVIRCIVGLDPQMTYCKSAFVVHLSVPVWSQGQLIGWQMRKENDLISLNLTLRNKFKLEDDLKFLHAKELCDLVRCPLLFGPTIGLPNSCDLVEASRVVPPSKRLVITTNPGMN